MSDDPGWTERLHVDEAPRGRYFSISAVDEYLECPQQYYLRRVCRKSEDRSKAPIAWRLGTVVHEALAAAYREQKTTPAPYGAKMIWHWPAARDRLVASATEEGIPTHTGDRDWALSVLQKALEWLDCPKPHEIALVEEQLVAVSDDGVIVHGYVDVAFRLSETEMKVRDWKITSRVQPQADVARSPQLGEYAWLVRRNWPSVTTVYVEEWYPPALKGVSVQSNPEVESEVLERVEMVAEMVELSAASGEWETRPGVRCDDCPVKAWCPEWT